MSKRTFIGAATSVPRVTKGTPGGTIVAGNTFTTTLTDENGNTIASVATATGTTVAQTCADIVAQWALETDPRLTAIQISNQTTFVQFTRSDSVTFNLATTHAQGGGGTNLNTYVYAVTTPGSNPAAFGSAANYAEEIVPVAADDITFVSGAWSMDLQQAAVVTGKVTFAPTWQGGVGGPGQYASITPSEFTFNSTGSASAYINVNAAAIPALVNGTAAPQNAAGLYLLGSAITTLTTNGGSVSVAVAAGETSIITTIINNGATVTPGTGVTLTSFSQSNGQGFVYCGGTNASVNGGTLTTRGTGTFTNVTVSGKGTFIGNSSGTITNLKRLGGTTDMLQSRVTRIVTNDTFAAGAVIRYDPSVLTITNGSQPIAGSGAVELTAKQIS